MNILLLGKTQSILHWTEDLTADLRMAGHAVTIVPTRDPRLHRSLERALLSPAIGAPLAAAIVRKMRRLAPDLILAVGRFEEFPRTIFDQLARAPERPPMVAWIGDTFGAEAAEVADLFDGVAYTDTGMLDLHETHGFRSNAGFVPLAATRSPPPANAAAERIPLLAFVAAATPNRRNLLSDVTEPVALFGPDWQRTTELAHHERDARRIDRSELATIYASHMGVLNIRHPAYVINGLNHRHFAPYIHGTPVLTDAQSDVRHCFEVGSEMLVYRDAGELNELYAALRRDPVRARAIGLAGQRRVLAYHTYARRLETIAALVGIKAKPAG